MGSSPSPGTNMSKVTKYRQCHLEKVTATGRVETTSYIPAKYAKVGWVVDLRGKDKSWDRGWTVVSAGPLVDEPPSARDLIKGHRKMTGDSAPRRAG